jgi:hypothetical protein
MEGETEMKLKKIAERDSTGEHWLLYELELPYGTTELIIQWRG